MGAVDRKDQRRAILTPLQPCRDDIGNQGGLVHRLTQLVELVVTRHDLDPVQIGMRWRENFEIGQVAEFNKLLSCRANN